MKNKSNSYITAGFPQLRLHRLRKTPNLRRLIRETQLNVNDLIYPLFVKEGIHEKQPIKNMPLQYQLPLKALKQEVNAINALGIPGVILFGIPKNKDHIGSQSWQHNGIIQQAIGEIKAAQPNLLVISDICLCEYTNHGHCGIPTHDGKNFLINHDETLAFLQKQVISHAKAGSDMMAPSGMIDGMVQAIRYALDQNGFNHIPILSYAAKYASCFYHPFREAAEGKPAFGDRKSYQLDTANTAEAMREVSLDIIEGVDMVMVKPALAYLDIILHVKKNYPHVPLGAYSVSGEYAMIKAASEKQCINEQEAVLEMTTAIKRAGADFILTYFAKDIANYLQMGCL